jgi:DNA-binding CsgD family transcriptional regulator
MSITLSNADAARLIACSRELLSVLDDPDAEAWAARVIACARPLLGADRMFMAVPTGGGFAMYHSDPDMRAAAQSYEAYYHTTDVYTSSRRRAMDLDVYSFDMLITRAERKRSEFWNDWILPYRLCNPVGVSRDIHGCPVPATLMGYKEAPSGRLFGERELEILQLLQPSFDAAIRGLERFHSSGNDLVAYVDRLPLPSLLIGTCGVVHANAAFTAEMGRDASEVTAAVLPRVRALLQAGGHAPGKDLEGRVARVQGGQARWSVHLLPTAGGVPLALVHFDLPSTRPISPDTCARFGLSRRQAEVAQLMAERRSYKEIAARLGIRPNTARRHCEGVLRRLGISSRAELQQTLADGGEDGRGG